MNTLSPRDQVDEQAARWTARLDGGAISQADRLALHAWLDENPSHRTAFEHYQLICDDTAESMPELAKLSPLARPDPVPGHRAPRWVPVALGLAACAAVAVLWALPYFRDTQTVATVAAQRSTLSLPDGSQTDLNARTKLYIDFRHERRFVRLESGEAYFAVAKDSAHPFLVETPAGTVRVTGTHFNIRLTADGHPEVTLLEGSVAFQNAAAQVMLVPCDQIDADGELKHLSAEQLDQVTAWRDGRIVLNGLSLSEAAARFAEFHGKTITVAPDLAAVQMGGSYSLDDLQGFLEGLSSEPLRLHVAQQDPDNFVITRR